MEAKVYKRAENKNGVAMRVLDGIHSEHAYESQDLDDLQETDLFVTCCKCGHKCKLEWFQDEPDEGENWDCSMNPNKSENKCRGPSAQELVRSEPQQQPVDTDHPDHYILKKLLSVINVATRRTPIVTSCFPVEGNDGDVCCDDAIKKLEAEIHGS
jgi:hypothetical protein